MMKTRNIHGSVIPNEEQDESANADSLKNKYAFCTYATTQQVLLRASSSEKIAFLTELFVEIQDHPYIPTIHHSLSKYFLGKITKYMQTLDYSEYIPDVQLPDNSRTMHENELQTFFEATLFWFKGLVSSDLKLGVFLSFISICGNKIVTEIVIKMKEILQNMEKIRASSEEILKLSSRVSIASYVEDLDVNDPDVQVIYKKRNDWEVAMSKYRSKIELSVYGQKITKESQEIPKKLTKTEKKSKKTTKQGEKSAELKDKAIKKNKTPKKTTKNDKNVNFDLDFIQLMPIWITIQIFKYLDSKTLKTIQGVNKYWEFVVLCINQEEKGRKKFNTWFESLDFGEESVETVQPLTLKPQFRFPRRAKNLIACDTRVHKALESQKNIKLQIPNTSLLQNVANGKIVEFSFPAENLQPFQRMQPKEQQTTKYIHFRPPCVHFDNITTNSIAIKDMPLNNETFNEFLSLQSSSFESSESQETSERKSSVLWSKTESTANKSQNSKWDVNEKIGRLIKESIAKRSLSRDDSVVTYIEEELSEEMPEDIQEEYLSKVEEDNSEENNTNSSF